MKTFNTKPEERLRQLERLLERVENEAIDIDTTLKMIHGEIADIKFTMSTGHFNPNELFEQLVDVNERASDGVGRF